MGFVKSEDLERVANLMKRVSDQSYNKHLEDKNITINKEKFFTPLIEAQREEGEKLRKELDKIKVRPNLSALPPPQHLPLENVTLEDEEEFLDAEDEKDEAKINEIGNAAWSLIKEAVSSNEQDTVTGVVIKEDGMFVGDEKIEIEGNDIIFKGEKYQGTEGFWNLLVKKNPVDFEEEDVEEYSRFMISTDALLNKERLKEGNYPKNSSRSDKWTKIQKPIWERYKVEKGLTKGKKPAKGKGFTTFLPSNPELLIKKLALSFASNQAGNTAERNNIVSILETLLQMNYLSLEDYKTMNKMIK